MHGMSQDSVLGTLLFNQYSNVLCDDVTLFCSGEHLKQLLDTVEIIIIKWFDINKLSHHLGKTKCIVFGNQASNPQRKLEYVH